MAKFPIKLLPLVGVIILLAVIWFFLAESEKESVEELSHEEVISTTDISAREFEFSLPDSDKGIAWALKAKEGGFSPENEVGWFKKFRIKFHAEDGLDFELEGNKGEFDIEKNEITFSGELKGKTRNSYLYTEHLMFQGKEGSLKSDEVITFVGPFFEVTGKGLFMDLKKETLEILKDQNSTFDKEFLNI